MLSTLLAAVAGAAVAFFLDPDNGRRRRNMSRDRAGAAFRGGFRGLARATRATTAEAYGLVRRVTHLAPDEPIPENDATLARRVESQVFRDPDIPKGQINVN